jgi:small subunit ribosomal protein S5
MADYFRKENEDGINDRVIQIDRITRVVKGGRRLRFRAIVVAGDGNGQVGLAVDKGGEVVDAIQKATRKAKSNMKQINLRGTTIPHEITAEYAGARVFLKPAPKGTGVIAGGAVRPILEVLGVKDVLSKIQGSSSKLNNAYATIIALQGLRKAPEKTNHKPAVEEKPAKTDTIKADKAKNVKIKAVKPAVKKPSKTKEKTDESIKSK